MTDPTTIANPCPESDCVVKEALVAALERSMVAIDDWLNTYAAELCDDARVAEARRRIGEYGTLSYIATVQEQNRAALASAKAQGGQS